MQMTLFLDLDNLDYYGDIPEIPENEEGRVEIFEVYDKIYDDLIDKDFIDEVNNLCGTLIDFSDSDFFNKDKCILLKSWLEARLAKDLDPLLKTLYEKLLEYVTRAIELGTGVVITP